MKYCDYSCRAVSPFEPKRNEEQHPDQRRDRHRDGLGAQLLTGDLTYSVSTFDLVSRLLVLFKSVFRIRLRTEGVQGLSRLCPGRIYAGLAFRTDFFCALMWNFDEEHAPLIEDWLNNRVPNAGGINR